jgi:hypothetical protein
MPSPSIVKKEEKKMAGLQSFVGKRQSKTVKFMAEDIKIFKLSTEEVLEIQNLSKEIKEGNDAKGFDVMKQVLKFAAEGAAEMADGDFDKLPLDELSKLSNQILEFSGLGDKQGK